MLTSTATLPPGEKCVLRVDDDYRRALQPGLTGSVTCALTCVLVFVVLFVPIVLFVGILSGEALDLYQWARGADLTGQIFAIFTIAVAAGEAAVGLGILLALFRLRGTTNLDSAMEMQG